MPFIDRSELTLNEPVPGYKGVFVHSENMTVAFWEVEQGANMPEHAHPHEQIASVIEGQFELTVAGESRVLDSGSVAIIPSNTRHSGKAITPCRLMDAFHPVRDDYV